MSDLSLTVTEAASTVVEVGLWWPEDCEGPYSGFGSPGA